MSPSTIKQHIRKISFSQQFITPAEPRETSDISDSFASGEINVPQIMEKNDKQINEKQIYSCSTPSHARPNTVRVSFYSQVFPVPKSDSFHNGISTLVTESCTHSKEIQIKETCSGKTGREILSFHAYLTGVGKSLLAKHY